MERNPLIKPVVLLILAGLPLSLYAEWFQDADTGCAVWGDHPQPIVKIHWSGECVDGKASGKGLMEVCIEYPETFRLTVPVFAFISAEGKAVNKNFH